MTFLSHKHATSFERWTSIPPKAESLKLQIHQFTIAICFTLSCHLTVTCYKASSDTCDGEIEWFLDLLKFAFLIPELMKMVQSMNWLPYHKANCKYLGVWSVWYSIMSQYHVMGLALVCVIVKQISGYSDWTDNSCHPPCTLSHKGINNRSFTKMRGKGWG